PTTASWCAAPPCCTGSERASAEEPGRLAAQSARPDVQSVGYDALAGFLDLGTTRRLPLVIPDLYVGILDDSQPALDAHEVGSARQAAGPGSARSARARRDRR